jgi:hypothetical protein
MIYGTAATPPPLRLGLRSCSLPAPGYGPYHTLLRPQIVSLSRCTVRNAGSARYLGGYRVEYGTVRYVGPQKQQPQKRQLRFSAAQVRRRLPSTRRSFDLCNTGTLSLDPAAYVDPEFLQQHRQKRKLLSRQFGVLGCSKYCLRRRCSLASRPHRLTLRAKK